MLFEQVDAAARWQCQAADRSGYCDPVTFRLTEIFRAGADLAVLLDQDLQQIVDRFEIIGMGSGVPSRHPEDVVS